MSTIVPITSEVVNQRIFAIDYELGNRFLDRKGRALQAILEDTERWRVNNIETNAVHLLDDQENLNFNFGFQKIHLSQSQSADVHKLLSAEKFGTIADTTTKKAVDALEIDGFTRIGFRSLLLYETGSKLDAQELLQRLEMFRIHDTQSQLGTVDELSFTAVVARPFHMLRIAIQAFEQTVKVPVGLLEQAKKKSRNSSVKQKRILRETLIVKRMISALPKFGILLDLDAFMEDPPYPNGLTIASFIAEVEADFKLVKPLILQERMKHDN